MSYGRVIAVVPAHVAARIAVDAVEDGVVVEGHQAATSCAVALKKYDAALAKKPRWLVFNKMDLLDGAERKKRAAAIVKKLRFTQPWFVVSAINGEGTKAIKDAVMEFLEKGKRK